MYNNVNDLNVVYSPSKWCKRFQGDGSTRYFNQFVAKGSDHVRKTIPCQLNNSYGEDQNHKFDIYGFNLPKDAPIFIFIHGGYWQEFTKDDFCYMAEMFYLNKIKTIVVGFNICPLITVAEQINEVTKGIKKSLEYAEECGSRKVVVAGHSSGAHLIACLLERMDTFTENQKKLIHSLVLISGIYDITPIVNTYVNDNLELTKNDALALSPQFKTFQKQDFKILIAVAEYESPAFIKQSEMFRDKLKQEGFNVEYFLYEEHDHYTIVENLVDERSKISEVILNLFK